MFKLLETQKYPVILLIVGVLLILCGFFEFKDIAKLEITPYSQPQYIIALLGVLFSGVSIALYCFDEVTLGWITFRKIKDLDDGITAKLSNTNINIRFGQLEKLAEASNESMVVLPANEFFDDECINDKKSALGAYVNYKFANQTDKVKDAIALGLTNRTYEEVEKEPGKLNKSYGVGVGVFMEKLLSSNQPLLFVSVTTKRPGEGLRSDMPYIFDAVKEIKRTMFDKRIDSVYLPLVGSGHGGLRAEVALFGILLAICDVIKKPSGHHIIDFNIVIFQRNEKDRPSISKKICKRLLRIASGMYS